MSRRLLAGVVAAVVLLALLAAALAVRSLLSPERFTELVSERVQAAGLELRLDEPAKPTVWPHLAVQLRGLQLRRSGYGDTLLRAREVLLVVPWRSLLRGEARISALHVNSPVVDMDEIQAWLGGLGGGTDSGVPQLPRVDAGISVADGTVLRGNQLLLKALRVQMDRLEPERALTLHVAALDARDRPLDLRLDATPRQLAEAIELAPLELRLSAGSPPAVALGGALRWYGGSRLDGQLDGGLQLADGEFRAHIGWAAGADADPAPLHVVLDGAESHLDLSMDPARVVRWWQAITAADGALPLPPVRGSVRVQKLDLGALKLEGVRVGNAPDDAQADPASDPGAAADPPAQ